MLFQAVVLFSSLCLPLASVTSPCIPIDDKPSTAQSLSGPNPEPERFRYRYEVFEEPGLLVHSRILEITLQYFFSRLNERPMSEPLRPDGLVFKSVPAKIMLTVKQEGDQTLVREDVWGALMEVWKHYDFPKRPPKQFVKLPEVHVLQGYYLQGLVTIGDLNGERDDEVDGNSGRGAAEACSEAVETE